MNMLLKVAINSVLDYSGSEIVKIIYKHLSFVSLNIPWKVYFTMKKTDFSSPLLSVLKL